MKRIFITIILALIITVFFAGNNTGNSINSRNNYALKLENIDNASRNILIHSIAFQRYNKIQYAVVTAHHYAIYKMMDTPDTLLSI